MKVIVENYDGELYVECVLRPLDMDILDLFKLVSKEIKVGRQKVNLSIRKETEQEAYEEE